MPKRSSNSSFLNSITRTVQQTIDEVMESQRQRDEELMRNIRCLESTMAARLDEMGQRRPPTALDSAYMTQGVFPNPSPSHSESRPSSRISHSSRGSISPASQILSHHGITANAGTDQPIAHQSPSAAWHTDACHNVPRVENVVPIANGHQINFSTVNCDRPIWNGHSYLPPNQSINPVMNNPGLHEIGNHVPAATGNLFHHSYHQVPHPGATRFEENCNSTTNFPRFDQIFLGESLPNGLNMAPPLHFNYQPNICREPSMARPLLNNHITSHNLPNKPAFKPHYISTYDGTTSWSDYERQVEDAAIFYQWSAAETLIAVTSNLRGRALSLYGTIPRQPPPTYEQVRQVMRDRFSLDAQASYRHFRKCVQSPKESIQDYATELERLSTNAFRGAPNEVVTQIVMHQFIDGLYDTHLQSLVMASRPSFITDAMRTAMDLQAQDTRTKPRNVYNVEVDSEGLDRRNNKPRNHRSKNKSGNEPTST
ncbi:uncharacterized protein LOC131994841 [Stomoxys calcitrans]|uniref:uncharacterized protein LOC131994841 n=1 Tax=Stomoxys calcitrans TaxID=35570 RepID=UPI0027E21FFA|nr:uncharacterized protein LOC131994841 [Stomoxys calcitrans]